MDYLVVPEFVERKGSLFLRSNYMNYGRPILNSNWHQAREAEPKDYDINEHPRLPTRNLHTTTYKRLGDGKDGFPKTTTQEQLDQIDLLDDYRQKEIRKLVIDQESYNHVEFPRSIEGIPERGFGAVLPRHHPDHNKRHLQTTHDADFRPPYPYTHKDIHIDFPDNSIAFKKCHSQFTDVDDYRRLGRNAFHDESGEYANLEAKRNFFSKTHPICERLE